MQEKLISRREVAETLGVCLRTIDTMIRSGMLKAIHPTGGRAVRIVKSDLDDFIIGCRENEKRHISQR